MLFAIDIGNTNIFAGLFLGSKKICEFRLHADKNKTADEYFFIFSAVIAEYCFDIRTFKKIAISSVVPQLDETIKNVFRKYLKIEPFFVEYSEKLKLTTSIKIKNPFEVGADRIANAEYAAVMYPDKNVIVVDIGTATTLDVITAAGDYIGGVITAGITLMSNVLFEAAAKLPKIDIKKIPEKVVGNNTEDCIRSGIIFGYASMIEGLINRIISEQKFFNRMIILTGGSSKILSGVYTGCDLIEEDLTLQGIRIIYEKNN